jgi:hypothetical protein
VCVFSLAVHRPFIGHPFGNMSTPSRTRGKKTGSVRIADADGKGEASKREEKKSDDEKKGDDEKKAPAKTPPTLSPAFASTPPP